MKFSLITATCLGLASAPAMAATLDFTGLASGVTSAVLPEATVTAAGDSVSLTFNAGPGNSVCGLTAFQGCSGDFSLAFNFDVNNLSLDYGFGNPADMATIFGYDALGGLTGSVNLTSTSGIAFADLSSLGVVRSLFFSDTSDGTGFGYAYGNINYDAVAAVPLPASLPLALLGLGAFGVFARKRKTA